MFESEVSDTQTDRQVGSRIFWIWFREWCVVAVSNKWSVV